MGVTGVILGAEAEFDSGFDCDLHENIFSVCVFLVSEFNAMSLPSKI